MSIDPYDRDPYAPTAAYPEDAPLGPPAYEPEHDPAPVERARAVRTWWSDRANLREWAFVGGLLGGVLILLGAFVLALLVTIINLLGAADPDVWFFDSDSFPGVALAVALWGLVSGGLVLIGALRLKDPHALSAIPGGAMLLGGLLSFFALGGFLVGGLAAIVAGVMGIAAAERVLPERRETHAPRAARPLP